MPRPTVLIVDDDGGILEALDAALSESYEIRTARNGEEGLEILEQAPVDVTVLDMRMPLLDGEGMLREMRERGIRTPVILVSAHFGERLRAHELGADAYLAKPFTVDQLEREIERLLRGRSSSGGSIGGPQDGGGRRRADGPPPRPAGGITPPEDARRL